jgi:hypothetical protein
VCFSKEREGNFSFSKSPIVQRNPHHFALSPISSKGWNHGLWHDHLKHEPLQLSAIPI